jgi:hypothetical protein
MLIEILQVEQPGSKQDEARGTFELEFGRVPGTAAASMRKPPGLVRSEVHAAGKGKVV